MARLMILGAGAEHVHVIRKAKAANHTVIVVDPDANRPGVALADVHVPQELMATEAIIAAAKRHQIDGVTTASLGIGMRTIGAVAEALNLPGLRKVSAYAVTDKITMRQRLQAQGLDQVSFQVVDSINAAHQAAKVIGLPVICKPPDGSGSRGVRAVHTADVLADAYQHAASQVRSPERRGIVLMESLVEGREISCDGFVSDNRVVVTTIRDKIMTPYPYRQEMGYSFPAVLSDELWGKIHTFIENIANNLDLNAVVFHADLFVCPDNQLALIEIGARLPGYGLVTDFIQHAVAIDLTEITIALALGESLSLVPRFSQPTVMLFFQPPHGSLKEDIDLQRLAQQPGVIKVQSRLRAGDMVSQVTDGATALHYGYIVTAGTSVEDARHHATKASEWFYNQLVYE